MAIGVGGVPEQLIDRETGILAAERDAAGFAQAVDGLLADPSRRRAMGAAGVADVARRFKLSRMVDDYLGWRSEALTAGEASRRSGEVLRSSE